MADANPDNDNDNDNDYRVVSFAASPAVKSVPLFLPSNLSYDPATNTVAQVDNAPTLNGDRGDDSDHAHAHAQPQYPLVLVPQAGASVLRAVKNAPVSCISCVGPYRTGKSLLMSRFLKDSKAFQVGSTLEGCTRGIWISTSAIVDEQNDNCHTFLLDCEGAGDPLEGDEAANVRIALASILISSIFMFNNTGRPDRGSLQFLSYLATIRKRLPDNSHDGNDNHRNFPSFLWIFRDFFLQLPLRKTTGKPYTLQEYMMERVLVPPANGRSASASPEDSVVDSLLNDFQSVDVLSIGYPHKGEESFTPEEMSNLDNVEWETFNRDFRADVDKVVQLCRSKAKPFTLAGTSKANGPIFVQWCNRVLELVNSDKVIPNLPDMQSQLLQSIADTEIQKAQDEYKARMQQYLDQCPVYNNTDVDVDVDDHGNSSSGNNNNNNSVIAKDSLQGVANHDELLATSDAIAAELTDAISVAVGTALAKNALQRFRSLCTDPSPISTSVLAKLITVNTARSQAACTALARSMYFKLRETVRADATEVSKGDFDEMVSNLILAFRAEARGPAVEPTIDGFIREQQQNDTAFLQKVHDVHSLYQTTLHEKEKLSETVQETQQKVESLENVVKETKEEHQKHIESMEQQEKERMEQLAADHAKAIDSAIAEQQDIQQSMLDEMTRETEAKLDALQAERERDMKLKEEELEVFRKDAEQKLAGEIAAREERIEKAEKLHKTEMEKLMKVADERMKAEIESAEEKRKKEIAAFNEEMNAKLQAAEEKMRAEIEERERRLKEAKEFHAEEMEQERIAMMKQQEEERNMYLKQIQELDNRCVNPKCVVM